jgi:hypothetical protein
MRALVTGGAGFIGSDVVEALASAGHEVRGLDALLPCVHPGVVPSFSGDPGFEFVHGDVRDAPTADKALRGVGAVCHLAAMVGLGVDFDDAPLYAGCNGLGTRSCSLPWPARRPGASCWPRPWSSTAKGPTPAPSTVWPRRRHRDPPPTATPAGSSRAASAAASRCQGSWCPRRRRYGRAMCARTPRSPRSTSPPPGPGDRGSGGGAALSQRVRPRDAPRHAVRRGGVVLPLFAGGRTRAAGLRGRSPAPELHPRPRRGRSHRRRV